MKTLLFIFGTLMLSVPLFAQEAKFIGLEKPLVKKLINQEFGNLINPQSNNNIGNFASLDLTQAEVNFGGNVIFNNGSILGIKAQGNVSDGFMPIFSNTKLNTKLGIDLQYNFIDFQKKKIIYDNSSSQKFEKLKTKIENDYKLKEIEIENGEKKILLQIELQKLTNRINGLEAKIGTLSGLSMDSLRIEILKLKQEQGFKQDQIKNLPSKGEELNELENWRAEEIIKAQSEIKVHGFRLGWFSIGYGVSNNSFKTFDGNLGFDQQISKASYASHIFKFQYSLYNKTPAAFESFFVGVGVTASMKDNFSNLSKVEVNETKNFGPNPNDRFITGKYNAYQGTYLKDLMSASIYGDLYWFLFDENKGAVHFYPEYKIVEDSKPSTSLGFGFLMNFKKKDKSENIINTELYVNLIDMFNTGNSSEKIFTRSDYGLRFTFPINFNSKL